MRRYSASGRVALLIAATALLAAAASVNGAGQGTQPESFQSLMDAAMSRMDKAMMVRPSGDPDRDFAEMMIPHHQGAIDMAEAELRFGNDTVLRRLAQGIIVEQQQEIAVMRQAIAALPQAITAPAPSMPQNYVHAHKEP